MRPVQALRSMMHNWDAIVQGIANQSDMFNQKLDALIQGMDNQSKLLSDRLNSLVQGMDNQSSLLNDRLKSLVQGVDNQSRLLNDKLDKLDASLNMTGGKMDAFMRAQIVMQRDQAEAIGELAAAIKELTKLTKRTVEAENSTESSVIKAAPRA
jgi:hypothetical protein